MNLDLPPPVDPAPPTAPGPAPVGEGLVEWVRGNRPAASYVLLGLAVLFLGATIALAVRAARKVPPPDPPPVQLDPDAPPPAPPPDPKAGDYTAGFVGTLYGFLVAAAAGFYLLVGLPWTGAGGRTEARTVILTVGGLLGLGLMLFGVVFFWRWSASLGGWLDKGNVKERLFVVVPLLMVVAGAGLVFLAVQPARAEERHNPFIRRLVYGSNLGLTVFLLLLVLVVGNVVVARQVPNKLDATQTGFYTLADSTKAFLAKLPEPATLYLILRDDGDRTTNDIRQFAYVARDASNGKLTVKFVSPVFDRKELARLQEKYPRVGRDDEGILVTAGEDEKRNAFIPYNDLFETDGGMGRRPTLKGFAGEARVMKELRFLADNEQKPVVYFTQGNGELALGGDRGAEAAAGGSAEKLKGFLEKAYLDVKPLPLGAAVKDPSVPPDAAVVVVAEPQVALSEAAAGALRKYMTERKGKLVVLAGAAPGLGDKGVPKTGLDGVLGDLNVRLGDKYLLTIPTNLTPDYRSLLTVFTRGAASNPVGQALARQYQSFRLPFAREVSALTAAPGYQATPLLATPLPTWLSGDLPADPNATFQDLEDNAAARTRLAYSESPRVVAVAVSEGATGRALVVGSGYAFSDQWADQVRGGIPSSFDLLAATVDWLRDRPPLPNTVESKAYQQYQFPDPAGVDTTRMIWFPLGLGLLIVVGLGAGVWVIRRK